MAYQTQQRRGHTVQPIHIASKWGGKCQDCGCQTTPGQTVEYIPAGSGAAPVKRVLGSGFIPHGTIKHLQGECGTCYVVHAIFNSTRKQVKISAYTAEDAAQQGIKPSKIGAPRPKAVEVWQGNIRVL